MAASRFWGWAARPPGLFAGPWHNGRATSSDANGPRRPDRRRPLAEVAPAVLPGRDAPWRPAGGDAPRQGLSLLRHYHPRPGGVVPVATPNHARSHIP